MASGLGKPGRHAGGRFTVSTVSVDGAAAAFQRILWLYPGTQRWLVLAGHGNNGTTPGEVIRADHIVTFIALKPGVLTGRLHYDDLGLGEWLKRETLLLAASARSLRP
nr:hypothetical protein [Sodalis glossinidius]